MHRSRRGFPIWLRFAIVVVMTVFSPALAGAASQDSGEKITLVFFNARAGEAAEMALIERYMDEHPNIESST